MKQLSPIVAMVLVVSGSAFAGIKWEPLDCKMSHSKLIFKATLSVANSVRNVQVDFKYKPTAAEANKVLQACVKIVAEMPMNNSFDTLGSAWVGEDGPVGLGKGSFYGYRVKEKKFIYL